MPPQQGQTLLDLTGDVTDLGTHATLRSSFESVAIRRQAARHTI
jgi:hypothetical protein